jgi:carboxyl-terminal processing protease
VKKRLIWALVATAFAAPAASLESPATPRLAPTVEHAQTAYLSSQLLGRYHYKTQPLDDAMSERIFERYLKALDPERLFFTQADIDSFSDARTRLDDAIQRGNLASRLPSFSATSSAPWND